MLQQLPTAVDLSNHLCSLGNAIVSDSSLDTLHSVNNLIIIKLQ